MYFYKATLKYETCKINKLSKTCISINFYTTIVCTVFTITPVVQLTLAYYVSKEWNDFVRLCTTKLIILFFLIKRLFILIKYVPNMWCLFLIIQIFFWEISHTKYSPIDADYEINIFIENNINKNTRYNYFSNHFRRFYCPPFLFYIYFCTEEQWVCRICSTKVTAGLAKTIRLRGFWTFCLVICNFLITYMILFIPNVITKLDGKFI